MTKTELNNLLLTDLNLLFADTKVSKKAQEALIELVNKHTKPKARSTSKPSYEEDGITYHYCRYYAEFIPEEEIVMSNGKSKGYSKTAIAVWNKRRRQVSKMKDEISNLVDQSLFEEAKELQTTVKELESSLNLPESFRDEEGNKLTVSDI